MDSTSTTPAAVAIRSGACLCKSVRYELKGEPFNFLVCHCSHCKKATGSAFMANAFFKSEQLTISNGQDAIKEWTDTDTDSGFPVIRSFCATCGASMFIKSSNPKHEGVIIVPTGSIESDFDWSIKFENHAAEKRKWVDIHH